MLSTIFVWFTSFFGWTESGFGMLEEDQLDASILAKIGSAIAWLFAPLGWGNWQAAVASITGLVAKENIVGTMGILYGSGELTAYQALAQAFTSVSGFSFLTCGFAYVVSFMINQFGNLAAGNASAVGLVFAFAALALFVYTLFFKKYNEAKTLTAKF